MSGSKQAEFDPIEVRDISVEVYKERLGDGEWSKMVEKDADNGEKLRARAASYDSLTRAYLRVLKQRWIVL